MTTFDLALSLPLDEISFTVPYPLRGSPLYERLGRPEADGDWEYENEVKFLFHSEFDARVLRERIRLTMDRFAAKKNTARRDFSLDHWVSASILFRKRRNPMKNLIIYATKTGYVTECVEKLSGMLKGEVDTINLAGRPPAVDPGRYDRIMIGGSIHAGKIQKVVKKFCAAHSPLLATKQLGLFFACLTPPEKAGQYFDDNFPPSLVVQAKAKGFLGGAVYYERLSPIERFIMKKISGTPENFSRPNDAGIEEFARAMG